VHSKRLSSMMADVFLPFPPVSCRAVPVIALLLASSLASVQCGSVPLLQIAQVASGGTSPRGRGDVEASAGSVGRGAPSWCGGSPRWVQGHPVAHP
jgi:hypothetical protein